MASSSATNSPTNGYNPGSFSLSPADGLYVCGMDVVDGRVVSINTRSIQNLCEASGVMPSGLTPIPSGVVTAGAFSSISFYDTLA